MFGLQKSFLELFGLPGVEIAGSHGLRIRSEFFSNDMELLVFPKIDIPVLELLPKGCGIPWLLFAYIFF